MERILFEKEANYKPSGGNPGSPTRFYQTLYPKPQKTQDVSEKDQNDSLSQTGSIVKYNSSKYRPISRTSGLSKHSSHSRGISHELYNPKGTFGNLKKEDEQNDTQRFSSSIIYSNFGKRGTSEALDFQLNDFPDPQTEISVDRELRPRTSQVSQVSAYKPLLRQRELKSFFR